MTDPPAFQFYPRDWLSSASVRVMSSAARGIYMTLLCVCWVEGSLPADDAQLQRLGDASDEDWRVSRDIVRDRFMERDGRLYHKRLDHERRKQQSYRKLQSRKGVKSAEARFNRGSTAVQPNTQTPVQPEGNSSSSSSSSSSVLLTDAGANGSKPRKAPPNDVARFMDWWAWGYQQFRGMPYLFSRPKDQATIAALLKTYGLPRLKQMSMFLWHDEADEWLAKTDRGIGILRSRANALADWIAQDERKHRRPCEDAPEPEAHHAA